MTLIIGIKCVDGIVIGSDGAATLGSLGTRTVEQPTKKLYVLQDKIIMGTSGPVGLGQRFKGAMDALYTAGALSNQETYQAMTIISNKFREYILPELQVAAAAKQAIGGIALDDALSSTLVALPIKGKPSLFQFNQQGSPEEVTSDLPYASIGSGEAIADPFLGFIRRVFWANNCPNLSDAVFAVVWTLTHAIKINPGGIAEPITVATLSNNAERGNDWLAKEDSALELKEHEELMMFIEAKLQEIKSSFKSESEAKEIPKP